MVEMARLYDLKGDQLLQPIVLILNEQACISSMTNFQRERERVPVLKPVQISALTISTNRHPRSKSRESRVLDRGFNPGS
jgi:hypothetical protein